MIILYKRQPNVTSFKLTLPKDFRCSSLLAVVSITDDSRKHLH